MCYSILSLILMRNCGFTVRELTLSSFLMVIFHLEVQGYSCTLVNLKFFARDLEKFVPWEDGSSSTVEVKNKKRRRLKELRFLML